MTERQVSLEAFGLAIEPTPAMLDDAQHCWQHSWCGTVVVIPGQGRPGMCPSSSCQFPEQQWWQQETLVAGLVDVRKAKFDAWGDGCDTGWRASGEGWNAEYPGDQEAPCHNENPYRVAEALA